MRISLAEKATQTRAELAEKTKLPSLCRAEQKIEKNFAGSEIVTLKTDGGLSTGAADCSNFSAALNSS